MSAGAMGQQAVSHSVKRPVVRSDAAGTGVPIPLNNGTQLAAKIYRLDSGKVGSGLYRKQQPLDPTGQRVWANSERVPIQAAKLPKTSYQKAFSCGDNFEIAEFFDAEMKPAFFLYDYSLGKGQTVLCEESALSNLDLETEQEIFLRHRQELLDEGWPKELVDTLFPEPEPETKEEPETSDNAEENRARSLRRAKNNARRIIQNERFDMMWTFTFSARTDWLEWADKKYFGVTRYLTPEQQRERDTVNKAWNDFQKRLKRHCKKHGIEYRWLKVLEIHDGGETQEEKRGTYHIHLATNLRINKMTLQKLWGFGIVHFTDFSKDLYSNAREGDTGRSFDTNYTKDPSFYMAKYIDKDFDEARKHKQKAFTKSQNIKTPQAIKDGKTVEEMKKNPLKAFELRGMCQEIREALKTAKMEDLQLHAPDLGQGSGIYPVEYQRWNPDAQEFMTVKGFVKKTYYSACLALPKYKARYERFLEKKRKKAEAKRQLSLF